jgi:hypothetical protein
MNFLAILLRVHVRRADLQGSPRTLTSAISSEDKKRFQDLNYLHLSRDPAERERFLKLADEYQEKIRESLKK